MNIIKIFNERKSDSMYSIKTRKDFIKTNLISSFILKRNEVINYEDIFHNNYYMLIVHIFDKHH